MRRQPTRVPCGMTLIELLITLALLGIVSLVVTVAVRRIDRPRDDDPQHVLAESLRGAVTRNRETTVRMTIAGHVVTAIAHADGSVTADSAFRFDQLSGRPVHAR